MKEIFHLNIKHHDLSIKEFIVFFTNIICSLFLFYESFYFIILFLFINIYSVFFHSKILHYIIPFGFIQGYFISYILSNDFLLFLPMNKITDKLEFVFYFYTSIFIFLIVIFFISNLLLNLYKFFLRIKKPH